MDKIQLIANDPWLEPYSGKIFERLERVKKMEEKLIGTSKVFKDFASGHLYFGLHQGKDQWIFRDWAPNATQIFLVGEFTDWKELPAYELSRLNNGIWEIILPPDALSHENLYRLSMRWEGGQGDRIPAWANRVVQDKGTLIFNAQVWAPAKPYIQKDSWNQEAKFAPLVYEAHIGMASEEGKVATYEEFRQNILPRVVAGGYNTLQLMAIQEHPYYGSFGYHVSSFFAASSRFGTPDDLKKLIDEAHSNGLAVIMDLVHSHAVKNLVEGLGMYDGTPYQFFHDGYRREHVAWDSLCFNYGKPEVIHFLLSNCRFWLEEYRFDGFRFDGVTSMLYLDHGLSRDFTSYDMYYDGQQDEDAITYLSLANKLIKQIHPQSITIAEEMSGMPGLATTQEGGGIGFDFRLAMGTPDYWIKIIKERSDEQWDVNEIYHELTSRRSDEKTISYAESHDQALVGDKTIMFRLVDKEMYDKMNIGSNSLVIERGLALHKMIRLVTLATAGGGYLNFMGNEFGHPEWIDFPREGNNWSYHYARRQWSLADNIDLKFQFLKCFDAKMIQLIKMENTLSIPWPHLLIAHNGDKILIFSRGELVFVFNFHPNQSYTDYGFATDPGKYKIILNTDDSKFGGQHLVDDQITYFSLPDPSTAPKHMLKLYIPARSAFVLKKLPTKSVHQG